MMVSLPSGAITRGSMGGGEPRQGRDDRDDRNGSARPAPHRSAARREIDARRSFTRFGPRRPKGEARSDQTGSIRMLRPAVWISSVAWPTNEMRHSGRPRVAAAGRQTGLGFDCGHAALSATAASASIRSGAGRRAMRIEEPNAVEMVRHRPVVIARRRPNARRRPRQQTRRERRSRRTGSGGEMGMMPRRPVLVLFRNENMEGDPDADATKFAVYAPLCRG